MLDLTRVPRGRRAYVTLGRDAGYDARKLIDDASRGSRCRMDLLGVTRHTAQMAAHQRLDASLKVRWQATPGDAVEAALSSLEARPHKEASWSIER